MMLLLLVIGGVAAMSMSSRGENSYSIEPKINLGSIPEIDVAQNLEDLTNKADKNMEDVVNLVVKKEENVRKFDFGDYDQNVRVRVKWLLYEASTMYDLLNYLEWYMQKNNIRGLDDLRAAGRFEVPILEMFNNLVALCRKRQPEFYMVWTQLTTMGQLPWLAANQWLSTTPNDVLNRLRQFDTSELAFKAAMEIAEGRSMNDVNEKLMYLYKMLKRQPSPEHFRDVSAKLQQVINNQDTMMQVDTENKKLQGRFALQINDGGGNAVQTNVRRTTHQARAPDEDPFSGKPGSYRQTALLVNEKGQTVSMSVDFDAATGVTDYAMSYAGAQPFPSSQQRPTGMDFIDDDWRRVPGETIAAPARRPIAAFNDPSTHTGQNGSAYASIDPRGRPIDADTKRDIFGVGEGGGMFNDSRADWADQTETYRNPAPLMGPMDDKDSNAPARRTNTPAKLSGGFAKATANKVKIPMDNTVYTKEVEGTKRVPAEAEYNAGESVRFNKGTDKPAPTSQQLDDADADIYNATVPNAYDMMTGNQPRDALAQKGNVETWPGKSGLRTINEGAIPSRPPTLVEDDDIFGAAPTAAKATGIVKKAAPAPSVPTSDMMTSPFVALKDPSKQTHLVSKGAATGGTYRSRSGSLDAMGLAEQRPLKQYKAVGTGMVDDQTVQVMDALDKTVAEL